MHCYRRVAYQDRCQIFALLQVNLSISEISKHLGFHKSTISREIKRNSIRSYTPIKANRMARKRYKLCRKQPKIDFDLESKICDLLDKDWSPEQISGRLRIENMSDISHQTIYNYIRNKAEHLRIYLRRYDKRGAGRLRQRQRRKLTQLSIHQRPKIVETRQRFGDWERDGMYAASKEQLLVHVERKSRYSLIVRMPTINPQEVTKLTTNTLLKLGTKVHTMTNDNGAEFRDSKSLNYPTYHCTPGRPNQRGTVENTVGLLRQYIKRNTDIKLWTKEKVEQIQNKLNLRPRKCLDYKTPYEVLFKTTVALAT